MTKDIENKLRLNKFFPKIPVRDVFMNDNAYSDGYSNKLDTILKVPYEYIDSGKFDSLPKESVEVQKIVPTQKFLKFDNLKRIEPSHETGAYLVKKDDVYYVLDGHHRIAMDILGGEKYVIAYVYDADKIIKEMSVRNLVRKVLTESIEPKRSLVVLVGPPSVGKSTWIKNNFPDAYIISRDDVVTDVANSFGWSYDDMFEQPPKNSKIGDYSEKFGEVLPAPENYRISDKIYSKVYEANGEVYKKMLDKTSGAHPSGKDIVVDMTNMNSFQRKNALKPIEGNEDKYTKIAVEFDFKGYEDLIKRVSKKREMELKQKGIHKTMYDYVFDRLFSSYEPVSQDEGFDKIISVNNIESLKKYLDDEKYEKMSESLRKIVRQVLSESIGQINEIDWEGDFSDVSKKCLNPNEIVDYLNRVRANAPKSTADREKFNADKPFIHAKSTAFKDTEGGIDVDYFIKTITTPPVTIINTNDKILKSGGVHEYVFKTGVPALRGIVYDIDKDKFYIVNTCPGAGACQFICYALKGQYIQYPASYDGMTRRLNYLLNYPEKYEAQMYNELKQKCEEYQAFEGYKSKVIIRWNDSGDFFTKRYVSIAENVMDRLKNEGYNIDSYAYTKVADVAKDSKFDTTFSSGANKGQSSKVDLSKQKNANVIPSSLFKGLNLMRVADEETLKNRVSNEFGIDKNELLTFDELMATPKGDAPRWTVIVTPNDGDDAAFRKDVKQILLTQH
jgi:hypothetical protein